MIFIQLRTVLFGLLLTFTSISSVLATTQCAKYKTKYQEIQILQKKGNSAKRSIALHEKSQKAWKVWQDCKKGKLVRKQKKV